MSTNTADQTITAKAAKFLTFSLGRECYGVSVLRVREIIRVCDITRVPKMPDYVRGVINLRGKIIPVVDLRLKFAIESAGDTERTCIVVVQVSMASSNVLMGLVVDRVDEVIQIASTEIEPAPDFGPGITVDYLLGMSKMNGAVQALIDIDRLLSEDALSTAAPSKS